MIKDDMLFIAIGGAGGNIVDEFIKKDKRYNDYCINTNYNDLAALENVRNKYPIPCAAGTSKNRDLAKSYARSKITTIVDNIAEGFVLQKNIYVVFSLDGGTGSGIAPSLLKILIKKLAPRKVNGKITPKKNFGIICTLPKYTVSETALSNTIECWNELVDLIEQKQIDSIFLLDNNKRRNVQDINKEFVDLFDGFINAPKPDIRGIIDEQEMNTLFTAKGMSYLFKVDEPIDGVNYNTVLNDYKKQSIFADYRTGSSNVLGVVSPNEIGDNVLYDNFGMSKEIFRGYANNYTAFAVMGCPVNTSPIELIQMRLHEKKQGNIAPVNNNLRIAMEGAEIEEITDNLLGEIEEDELTIEDLEDMFY